MPKATLSKARLDGMLSAPLPTERLRELLFASKAELGGAEGDSLTVEATPDRLDLLCEGGLGLYLSGVLGEAHGTPGRSPGARPPEACRIEVDPSVGPLRPAIGAVIATPPAGRSVDEGLLAEAVRFQELLHATVGFDRRLASLGLYPLDRLRPPIRYATEPIEGVEFEPLDGPGAVAARTFLGQHPLAQRYAGYGVRSGRLLTLRDAAGSILSLPPILNARGTGEVRAGDGPILIESTGIRAARVAEALGLLGLVFLARGWSIAPLPVSGAPSGSEVAAWSFRRVPLRSATLSRVAGRPYPASSVEHLLGRARLAARSADGGWEVDVPPWRPDLIAEIDLVEEVVLADGVRAEDSERTPSPTRGGRRSEGRFHRHLAELLLGSGFSEMFSPVLVSDASIRRLGRNSALELTNPVSDQFGRLRDSLSVSLADALARNVRRPYPQRIFEVGPVIVADRASETGAASRVHVAGAIAEDSAGFATAASVLDYLLGAVAGPGIREPVEIPGMIPGRCARVRLAGEPVGEIGEFAPSVLSEIKVPLPVAWFELDLAALWPLARRAGETPI